MDKLDLLRKIDARINASEQPDRETDALLRCLQLGDGIKECRYPTIDAWVEAALRQEWAVPGYTGSLDTALDLIEDVLPGWRWLITRRDEIFARVESPDWEMDHYRAGGEDRSEVVSGVEGRATGSTRASALLRAAVSALIQVEQAAERTLSAAS